jgi:iron(III) transport system ATP-binding protein
VARISVDNLVKSFGQTRVLDGIAFEVRQGELVTMLGPSGCGKTTTLLCIAGLEEPDDGHILCGDDALFDRGRGLSVPAEKRNIGVVFQSYAIWPHMTVLENVAFPLKLRRIGRAEIRRRAMEALELVEMQGLEGRYPHQLSGGQQQRVALARALGYSPGVLLLDEPFSNLDAKLRERARGSVRRLQQRLGLTTILVTHDQDEALSMSDRVLVMENGRILQSGTAESVYRRPASRFVAEFVGRCNFIAGVADDQPVNGSLGITVSDGAMRLRVDRPVTGLRSRDVTVAIRPEAIDILESAEPSAADVFPGTVERRSFLGDHYEYDVRLGDLRLTVASRRRVDPGGVGVHIPRQACTLLADDAGVVDSLLETDTDG